MYKIRLKKKFRSIFKKNTAIFLVLLLCIFLMPIGGSRASANDKFKKFKKYDDVVYSNENIIIKFKSSITEAKKSSTLNSVGSSYKKLSAKDTVKAKIPEGKTPEEFIDEMNASPEVEYAQPDFIYQLDMTVNDPFITIASTNQLYQWHHDTINSYDAWDTATGEGVVIAVLDTGLDLDHTEFIGQVILQTDTEADDGIAEDDEGHGTHVAGIIAAKKNNNIYGAGVAPDSKLIIVDVFYEINGEWRASSSDIIDGIIYAVQNGADIINLSLGQYEDDTAQESAINDAVSQGVVVVCAAGNDSTSNSHYPSDYDSAISVISTNYTDTISDFSNFGSQKDISAPGGGVWDAPNNLHAFIISTDLDNGYAGMYGTSMAAPVISGVCALMLSINPYLSVNQVKDILYTTTVDLGEAGKDEYYANGLVDARAAVLLAADTVTKVELSESTLDIELGYTQTLLAEVLPATDTNKGVAWSSSNTDVATVSETGVVTGISLGGAVITVTTDENSLTDTCNVTVSSVSVTSVTLNQSILTIEDNSTGTLIATVHPDDAANKDVSWSSSNMSAATVSDTGTVTAVSPGETVITVATQDGSFSDTCTVTVTPSPNDVTGIALTPTTLSLEKGTTGVLSESVLPSSAVNKSVTWSTSDESVAIVANGTVTAVADGSAVITVTTVDGSFNDTCTVTVTTTPLEPISDIVRVKISLNQTSSVSVYVDGNYDIDEYSSGALERQLYEIRLSGSSLELYYGADMLYSGSTITFKQHLETALLNNFIWLNNALYGSRGYLGDMVFSITDNKIQAVNHIYLEEYLYGVVPSEMNDSWPIEALKAQAVAARSYIASSLSSGSYDVSDTSADQVYKGFNKTKTNSITAIDSTRKLVLQYNGEIVPAFYGASNGGITDIPYHVWGGGYNLPYSIREDIYDAQNSSSLYEEIFFPYVINGANPITTSDNVVSSPNIDNAVLYFKEQIIADGSIQAAGYDVVTADDIITLTGVLSFTPHTYDADGDHENHALVPISGTNDCIDYVMAAASFTVMANKEGVPTPYTAANIELDLRYFDGANGDDTYKVFNESSLRLFVIKEDGGFSIAQKRYGHGVGMSQRGAQARAADAQTYSQILAFYYDGASLANLTIDKPALTIIPAANDNSNARVNVNDYLNVRSGTGTNFGIIGTLPPDARIEVITEFETPDWHRINYGGDVGFVHKDYIVLIANVSVESIDITDGPIEINVGETHQMSAQISPSNATNQQIIWSSDNSSITVNAAGLATAVSTGTANITATSADGGFTDSQTITVTGNPAIESSVYTIDQANSLILNIVDETTIADFTANLNNDPANIKIYAPDGTQITNTSVFIGTGMVVKLVINSAVTDELEVCILGDVDGNGVIDILDYTYVRLDIFNVRNLTGVFELAGDVDLTDVIDILDYTYIRLDIFDLKNIN